MKKRALVSFLLLAALVLGVTLSACGDDREKELEAQVQSLQGEKSQLTVRVQTLTSEKEQLEEHNAALESLVGPLPASLDALYPPNAPAPIWLLEMFTLSSAFEGTFVDLLEGDMPNAMANWQAFKDQYVKVSKLVPEWEDRFPMEPLNAFEDALATGDPEQIMGAAGGFDVVCGACHVVEQSKVRSKYHWLDFGAVTLVDPASGETLPWGEFMGFAVALPFSGIGNSLQQGELDNARHYFEAFNAGMATLREGCNTCHTTPREYFVDARVQADIDALGVHLMSTTPDPAAIGGLMQKIGQESCGNCHLVHQPAQHIKDFWAYQEEIMEFLK